MRTGIAPLTLGRPSPAVLVQAAAAAGFARVGFTLWTPEGPLDPLCHDAAGRAALRGSLGDAGVEPLDVGVVVLQPSLDLAHVARLVEAATEIGADRLIVANRDTQAQRASRSLASVCELADQAGLLTLLEFMPYTATRTLSEASDLVSATGNPSAGVVLDVLHLFRSGGTVATLDGPAGRAIRLVQLCDGPAAAPPSDLLRDEALHDRRYPGEGAFPLADVLGALPPDIPVTVEAPVAADAGLPPEARARAAMAALRRLEGSGEYCSRPWTGGPFSGR